MSLEKNRQEAERWLKTAEGDLETAVILLENKKYAHSCFHSQQAGEKAIKAVWYLLDADPWGHSIQKLIQDLKHVDLNTTDKHRYFQAAYQRQKTLKYEDVGSQLAFPRRRRDKFY